MIDTFKSTFILLAGVVISAAPFVPLRSDASPSFLAHRRGAFAGGSYTANATTFAGDGQTWMERDGEGTGVADGKTGTVSFWIDPTGSDTDDWRVMGTSGGRVRILRGGGADAIEVTLTDTSGTTVVSLVQNTATVSSITASDGWVWVAASWDNTTAGNCYIYISKSAGNATDCTTRSNDTGGNEDIDWTNSDWAIGSLVGGGGQHMPAVISELYLSSTYYDLSQSSNRDLFYDSTNHKPAGDLTSVGSPEFYFKSAYDSFGTNSGSAGNFTKYGSTALSEGTPP